MFTIRRNDEFITRLVDGTPHCGVGTGMVTFKYEAWVIVADEGLDMNGFVIDNMEFKKYFDTRTTMDHSCEMACMQAGRHFFKLAARKSGGIHILEVCVRIWGLSGIAYAEYLWKRGK